MAKVIYVCEKKYAVAVKWNPAIFGKTAKKVHIHITSSPKIATTIHKVIEKINRKTFIDGNPLFSNIEVEVVVFPEKEIESSTLKKETPNANDDAGA